jgi:hypothetical protein
MKNTTNNAANKLRLPLPHANAKTKRLALRIEVGKSNLASEVKRVFDMAKSSGLELDLTFSQKQMSAA